MLLDGNDLSQFDPAWLRAHIGVVLQENILFNRSIHDNIAFANPAMRARQGHRGRRSCRAPRVHRQAAAGYDTMIEERGANLSGGQRQRIAIARALRQSAILIFDEATSALDYESERIIQANMRHIAKDAPSSSSPIGSQRCVSATASMASRPDASWRKAATTSCCGCPTASMPTCGACRTAR